jgi:hypothetical protein
MVDCFLSLRSLQSPCKAYQPLSCSQECLKLKGHKLVAFEGEQTSLHLRILLGVNKMSSEPFTDPGPSHKDRTSTCWKWVRWAMEDSNPETECLVDVENEWVC